VDLLGAFASFVFVLCFLVNLRVLIEEGFSNKGFLRKTRILKVRGDVGILPL